MKINEVKIYSIVAILLISTQFVYFYTTNGNEQTCGLGYFMALKYGNLGPKFGFESKFHLSFFHLFGYIANIPYGVILLYSLITYGLKHFLNCAIIYIPKKIFFIIATLPSIIMLQDFYCVFYHPGKLMHLGYIVFTCLILIGNITILITFKNGYASRERQSAIILFKKYMSNLKVFLLKPLVIRFIFYIFILPVIITFLIWLLKPEYFQY